MMWQSIDEAPQEGLIMMARMADDGIWDFVIAEVDDEDFIFDDGMCISKDLIVTMFPYFSLITPPVMQ